MLTLTQFHAPRPRYFRSVHMERDFADAQSLADYVVTDSVRDYAARVFQGVAQGSGRRAWRVTGSYGTGKSAFALYLAQVLRGRHPTPKGFGRLPRLLPVLVTCAREPLTAALCRGVTVAIESSELSKKQRQRWLESFTPAAGARNDANLVDAMCRLAANIDDHDGVLLIIDELGKSLESAALHPETQDVMILQGLAEAASRSGKRPLVVVGLLHQNMSAYAEGLGRSTQLEWEKIAGRYEDIHFAPGLDDVTEMIYQALPPGEVEVPASELRRATTNLESLAGAGWFGPLTATSRVKLSRLVPALYPLHPAVIPVMTSFFQRFGQQERSLFGFLLSDEPSAFGAFTRREYRPGLFYRLADFYDYVRSNFGYRLGGAAVVESQWHLIESTIDHFTATNCNVCAATVLKTTGILNLLNAQSLVPTHEVIRLAVADDGRMGDKEVDEVVANLKADGRLFDRGPSAGYCLWSYTSVNLADAYNRAIGELPPLQRIPDVIARQLSCESIVARRHYLETGNLRSLAVRYCGVSDMAAIAADDSTRTTDGVLVVVLCETERERKEAIAAAKRPEYKTRPDLLVAVPAPLHALGLLVEDVRRWGWVAEHIPELRNDRPARLEAERQLAKAKDALTIQLDQHVGLRRQGSSVDWLHAGAELPQGKNLVNLVSDICDTRFPDAPCVHHELLNRRQLSSAAAAARLRLLQLMCSRATEPCLGMDLKRRPPEMSIYLSVLQHGGVHRAADGGYWELAFPDEHHDTERNRLLPSLNRIRRELLGRPDERVPVTGIYEALRSPPYGVRDGLLPVLLVTVLQVHQHEMAIYENGTFVAELAPEVLQRLVRVPQGFQVQYCQVQGVRASVYAGLVAALGLQTTVSVGRLNLLDVVRPLCQFAGELPEYSKKTLRVSPDAQAVRAVILQAREPVHLIFRDLPRCCGMKAFAPEDGVDEKRVTDFIARLKRVVEELRGSFGGLKDRMRGAVQQAFGISDAFQQARRTMAERATVLVGSVTEPRLKGFCLRFIDDALPEKEWLESLGNFVVQRPPSKWTDADENAFNQDFAGLAGRFLRVEALNFNARAATGDGYRVHVTSSTGEERSMVVYLTDTQRERLAALRETITRLVREEGDVVLAATSQVLFEAFPKELE